jgi:acetate kinase
MQAPVKNMKVGLEHVFHVLMSKLSPNVRDEVKAVGHRVVHGGRLASSVVLDDYALKEVKRAAMFAPLHNPAQLAGIEACDDFFPGRAQVSLPYILHTASGALFIVAAREQSSMFMFVACKC